jgi:dynein heavy chain
MFLDETLTEVEVTEEEMRENIVNFMSFSFDVANQASKKILEAERRHVHNTPKSFLELITLFKNMLLEKRQSLIDEQFKYEMGLAKLKETEETVIKLEAELKIKNVEVSQKKEEANKVAEVVGKEKASVEEENKKANEKEKECTKISIEVQA